MLRRLLGGGRTASAPVLATLAAAALSAVDLPAQDPPSREPERSEERAGRRGRRSAPVTAIRAGFVHPVSGPTIEDGVVLIRGSRILAVGPAAEVEIKDGATVLEYPDGHVYPGFVDALSRAFASDIVGDGKVDAGAQLLDALDPFDEDSSELAAHGVTTAYVSNRSGAAWRGQGALIRPSAAGFRAFPEHRTAGVHMRLTNGPSAAHPLQRLKILAGFGKEFDQLEAYEKTRDEYAKKLEEYEKKFGEFLDWHRKHGDKKDSDEKSDGEKDSGKKDAAKKDGSGASGGKPTEDKGAKPKPPAGGGKQDGKPKAGDDAKADPKEKAPERPKYPPEPKPDPAKDALIAVRDGELALFVEAHRIDEVERALELARKHELQRVVIELATGAADAAAQLADAGVPVVLDTTMPPAVNGRTAANQAYVPEPAEQLSVAAELAAAGAPFALGSGSNRRARHLPSLVAEAVGQGIDLATALRAITLTPAEILGIADRVGSIEPRKLADLVITSAPLEASDARVLRVMSAGTTLHEAR